MNKDYKTLILAALLHDIGKPLTWAHFDKEERNHAELSARIVDHCFLGKSDPLFLEENITVGILTLDDVSMEDVRLLVLNHHGDVSSCNIPTLHILRQSDRISASERDDSDIGFNSIQLMENPFSHLFNHQGSTNFQPNTLTKDRIIETLSPCLLKTIDPQELRNRCKDMLSDLSTLSNTTQKSKISFETFLSWLDLMLYKHLWMWPSSRRYQERRDVSLYDHVRFTSGLATSIFFSENKSLPFKFILGDFSGIQNYIFNLSGTKAAKRLRAKSFWVQSLQENLIFQLLKTFQLNRTCIISNTGGKFIILCPSSIEETVFRKETTPLLFSIFREYKAEISISLTLSESYSQDIFSAKEDKWKKTLSGLNSLLQKEKVKPHAWILNSNSNWNIVNTCFPLDKKVKACDSCGLPEVLIEDQLANEKKCQSCINLEQLGKDLVKDNPIIFFQITPESIGVPNIGIVEKSDYSILINPSFDQRESKQLRFNPSAPLALKFMANHVPKDKNGSPLDFAEIAEKAKVQMLAVLKADVDNLGLLFRDGLTKANTPSRFMSVSRLLDMFFSGYLDSLVQKDFSLCYFIYAGGDDLVIVGPWTTVFDFAETLREKFAIFTDNNKKISLSAGISLFKPKQPILSAVKNADDELFKAKQLDGKNAICFWGKAIHWDDYTNLIKPVMDELTAWFSVDEISTQFGRHLLTFSRMMETGSLRWKPILAYQISRNLEKAPDKFRTWCKRLLEEDTTNDMKLIRRHLPQIVQYALYRIRGNNE